MTRPPALTAAITAAAAVLLLAGTAHADTLTPDPTTATASDTPTPTDTPTPPPPPVQPGLVDRSTVHVNITPTGCGAASISISIDPAGQSTSLDITDVPTDHVPFAPAQTVQVEPGTTQVVDYRLTDAIRTVPGPDLVQVAINTATVDGISVPDGGSAMVAACPPASSAPAGGATAPASTGPAPVRTIRHTTPTPAVAAPQPHAFHTTVGGLPPLFPAAVTPLRHTPPAAGQSGQHGEQTPAGTTTGTGSTPTRPTGTTTTPRTGQPAAGGALSMIPAAATGPATALPAGEKRSNPSGSWPLFALLLLLLLAGVLFPTARAHARELAARVGNQTAGKHRH